jgi:hypothetical protein
MVTESARELPAPRVRWFLIAALVAAMIFAVLLFRSFGPLTFGPLSGNDTLGALVFLESFPTLAVVLLILPSSDRLRFIGAGIAYFSAALVAFVSFAMAMFPGGAPSEYDRSRPAPLNTTESLIGVTVAVAAVMFCATRYARRGGGRKTANILTVVYLAGCIVLKTLFFR